MKTQTTRKELQELVNQMPGAAYVNGEYFNLIWEIHKDGVNFTSYRLGPDDLKKLIRR